MALSYDVVTRELSWVYTEGLDWYGYPELAARVPRGLAEEEAAPLAVFLMAGLVTLGHEVLGLDGFLGAEEIPPYSAWFRDVLVTLWVSGFDALDSPRPSELIAKDVLLVSCSLWS